MFAQALAYSLFLAIPASLLVALGVFSLFAEFIANDKPLVMNHDGRWYAPLLVDYPETEFGGFLPTRTDYHDPFIREQIEAHGWALWPPIPFSYQTLDMQMMRPSPAPPDGRHWLGTDDQGRDVLARVIYGFRLSVAFALVLTAGSLVMGVILGGIQGYFGGKTDLIGQRLTEIWSGLPVLFLLIILASFVQPGFWWLLGIMLLFSWLGLVDVVRYCVVDDVGTVLNPLLLKGQIHGGVVQGIGQILMEDIRFDPEGVTDR